MTVLQALKRLEWCAQGHCPACGGRKPAKVVELRSGKQDVGHKEDCWLDETIKQNEL